MMKLSPSNLTSDLSGAAADLRRATRNYREALLSGDLRSALRAKDVQLAAEVRLDRARWLIEGETA